MRKKLSMLVVDGRVSQDVANRNIAEMSHEYIYEGASQIGVRIYDAAEEFYPLLRTADNTPVSQMEIRMKAVAMGADTPGVWDWRSVGIIDDDVCIFWEHPASTCNQDVSDVTIAETQSRLM